MQEKNTSEVYSFGSRLRDVLKENRLTRGDLASLMGVHLNTVGHWIRNEKSPSLDKIRFMAHHLDVSFTWLITGETPTEYATRLHIRSSMVLNDESASYGMEEKERLARLITRIMNLAPEDRILVESIVEKIGREEK